MSKQFWLSGALLLFFVGGVAAQTPAADHPHAGHHMGDQGDGAFHHRFEDAEKWAKQFDNPEREAWQKPDRVIDALKLPATALVADIGAGTGYFSVRLAKRVPQGKVFATDIEPDMVRYLGERARREGLANLVPVQSSADNANLPEPVDLILFVDAYHHIGNRADYFARLRASLKPGGLLALVDFRMESPQGPPPIHRIPFEKAVAELKAAGYTLVGSHDFLPRQYFALFAKSAQ